MWENIINKKIRTNFSFALLAQLVQLLVSCVTNLILPKILGANDFTYWQLFIFYAMYIPCIALGLNDGVYLRYGGIEHDKLDYSSVKSQYLFGIIFQLGICLLLGTVTTFAIEDWKRKIVIYLVLVYVIFYSSHNYIGYIFQAINETNVYSKSLILCKAFYLGIQVLLLAIGIVNVFVLILFYIGSFALALGYLLRCIWNDFSKEKANLCLGVAEGFVSMKTGISLMISNICSMLVLAVGRQVVDMHWGMAAFGKVSFSLTLMNFALTFISQISMVLFPALRQVDEQHLFAYYGRFTKGLFLLLPIMYLLYFPGKFLLNLWLPEYVESIAYLGIVLPICFFECKMNLIGNTFFKVLNKQMELLKINVVTIGISFGASIIGAFLFDNMTVVIIGMVVAVVFRSVLADVVLSKTLKFKIVGFEIMDIGLAALFVIGGELLEWRVTMTIMLTAIVVRIGWGLKGKITLASDT